jgi:hypothetical protein
MAISALFNAFYYDFYSKLSIHIVLNNLHGMLKMQTSNDINFFYQEKKVNNFGAWVYEFW